MKTIISQTNIQKPITNAAVTVLVCVDGNESEFSGRFFCQLFPKEFKFNDIIYLVSEVEKILDTYDCPHSYTAKRTFTAHKQSKGKREHRKESLRHMTYDEMLSNKGDLGTFIISVRFRQNATWQGSIKWVEGKEEATFRSVLEMLSLMKEAIE